MNTQTTNGIIETVLHYYYFNTAIPEQKHQYEILTRELKAKGLKLFDSISSNSSDYYNNSIRPLDGKIIQLETNFLFNNQWNTAETETSKTGLRVFDWAEGIYINNRKIKEGQYLEQTETMTELRHNTYKCGYCGKQYYKPKVSFCTCCLSSEYLQEDQLFLLFLMPIASESDRKNVIVPDSLITQYKEKQRIARTERLEKSKIEDKKRAQDKLKKMEIEYQGFKWLIDNDMNFDNVIYYDHSNKFSFGWRKSYSETEKETMKVRLTGFPFPYEIK